MGYDWGSREMMLNYLKQMPYDTDKVAKREDLNLALFERHKDLIVPNFSDHYQYYIEAFGDLSVGGVGALDIGTGDAGVFLLSLLTSRYAPPLVATDIFEINVPDVWKKLFIAGQDILKTFGAASFDYVQCAETLEHTDEDTGIDIAWQMLAVSRKRCLITSMGLSHHLGEANAKIVSRNSFLSYQGQPNIERLMELGYNVRLVGNYQIFAWYDRERSA